MTLEEYLETFCKQLQSTPKCKSVAKQILDDAKMRNSAFIGKNPKGIVAAAIYLASKIKQEDKTQEQIAEIAKISEVTLRKRQKDLINLYSTS